MAEFVVRPVSPAGLRERTETAGKTGCPTVRHDLLLLLRCCYSEALPAAIRSLPAPD